MNDATLPYMHNVQQTDLLATVYDTVESTTDPGGTVGATFFSDTSVNMTPLVYQAADDHWFVYVLLFLLMGVAVLWYVIPERLSSVLSLSVKTLTGRSADKGYAGPGAGVSVFFLFNSLITMSFLALYVGQHVVYNKHFTGMGTLQMFVSLALILGLFSLAKLLMIRVLGVLFKTAKMAKKQQMIYIASYNATGVLLLPLLFVLMVIPQNVLLYFILFLVAIMFVYRWVQTIVIGINSTDFNTFHLILYLCTLEIIPMMIFLKVFM